jgi:cytochrome c-type biogenesis protein CcmE
MSRLDDELAQAIERREQSWPAGVPLPQDISARRVDGQRGPAVRRTVGLLLALVVMGGAVLTLVLTSVQDAAIYSKGVDELVAQRQRLLSSNVRVEGNLVSGSLRRRDQPCEYRFALEKNGVTLPVRYAGCVVPDTFRDLPGSRVAVTVEGRLAEAGYLAADRILAKCPSRYDMSQRAAQGQLAPHRSAASAEARARGRATEAPSVQR